MALTLAVVLQPEKRQSHACKGKPPFRQYCGTDVQDLADGRCLSNKLSADQGHLLILTKLLQSYGN
jgi:hypothetical protein